MPNMPICHVLHIVFAPVACKTGVGHATFDRNDVCNRVANFRHDCLEIALDLNIEDWIVTIGLERSPCAIRSDDGHC